jgi:hypothetical protein
MPFARFQTGPGEPHAATSTEASKKVRLFGTVRVLHYDVEEGNVFKQSKKPLVQKPKPTRHTARIIQTHPPTRCIQDIDREVQIRRTKAAKMCAGLRDVYIAHRNSAVDPTAFPSFPIWKALVSPGDSRVSDEEREDAIRLFQTNAAPSVV